MHKMWFASLLCLVFSLFLLFAEETVAQDHSVCDEMLMREVRERFNRTYNRIDGEVYGNSRLGYAVPATVRDRSSEYYVTLTSGTADQIDCDSGLAAGVYFPIGIMLKPLRKIQVRGREKMLYLTEYGLRLVFDPDAVGPVREQDAYIVADSTQIFAICRRNDTDCDSAAERVPSEQRLPAVSAHGRYLYTDDVAMIDRIADFYDDFRKIERNRERWDPQLVAEVTDAACQEGEFYTFPYFLRPKDTPRTDTVGRFGNDMYHPVRFNTCTIRDGAAYSRTIKFVTHAIASDHFKALVQATPLRKPGDKLRQALRILEQDDKYGVPEVRCGESVFPGPGQVPGVGGDGPVQISQILRAEAVRVARGGQRPGRQTVFHMYQPHGLFKDEAVIETPPIYDEVELVIRCQDGEPFEGDKVLVHHSLLRDQPLELDVDDMFDYYIAYNTLTEGGETSGSAFGGVTDRERRSRLRQGTLFRICEITEYIYWRDALLNLFRELDALRDIARNIAVDEDLLSRHFTHLVMASVFAVDLKTRLKRFEEEGCDKDDR